MRPILLVLLCSFVIAAAACDPAAAGVTTHAPAASAAVVIGGTVVDRDEAAGADPHTGHAAGDSQHADARPGPLVPGTSTHYGAPFTVTGEPLALSEAIRTCEGTGQACLVRGTIERVCQVSGCWFTVAAPDVSAVVRIRMANYAFVVPGNLAGADIVFEGTLVLKEVPQARAQHYADDEAGAAGQGRQVDGPELTYEFTITGATATMPMAQAPQAR